MTHDDRPADAVSFECDLEAPPEQVWRALTEPELLAAWLEPDAIQPADDGRGLELDFDREGYRVALELLDEEPRRLLRYRWRSVEGEGGGPNLDSVVTFELSESEAGGTHLRIVHVGLAATFAAPAPRQTFQRHSAVAGVRGATAPRPRRRGGKTIMRLAA